MMLVSMYSLRVESLHYGYGITLGVALPFKRDHSTVDNRDVFSIYGYAISHILSFEKVSLQFCPVIS